MNTKIAKLLRISKYPLYINNLIIKKRSSWLLKSFRKSGVLIGDGTTFLGKPILTMHENSRITIGKGVSVISISEYTALGVNHPCIIRTLAENTEIVIKDNAGMSGAIICCASRIEIGERVMLGANVTITDTDFHSLNWKKRWTSDDVIHADKAPIVIGDDVFVGMNAVILKNVTIGEKSVIGANSVVTKDIPPYSIAAGNPAKIIGNVQDHLDK